jgi:hypothetical protein
MFIVRNARILSLFSVHFKFRNETSSLLARKAVVS